MPASPPSPSSQKLARRLGSTQPERSSSRLGKRSSPPRGESPAMSRRSSRIARPSILSHHGSNPVTKSEGIEQDGSSLQYSLNALTPSTVNSIPTRPLSQLSTRQSGGDSNNVKEEALRPRVSSGIPPPSAFLGRTVSASSNLPSQNMQPPRPRSSTQVLTSLASRHKSAAGTLHRRCSLQPGAEKKQAAVPSAPLNSTSTFSSEFTFTSRPPRQPQLAVVQKHRPSEAIPAGVRQKEQKEGFPPVSLHPRRPVSSMARWSGPGTEKRVDPPAAGRSSSATSRVCSEIATPRRRSSTNATSPSLQKSGGTSSKIRTLRKMPSVALLEKHVPIDTPVARERGLRRLGSLMLLPGRKDSIAPASNPLGSSSSTVVQQRACQEIEQGSSRSSTPTQRDYDQAAGGTEASVYYEVEQPEERAASNDVRGRNAMTFTALKSESSDHDPQVRHKDEPDIVQTVLSPSDQTCATLAAMSLNEETLLVGNDEILVDLRRASSCVDEEDDDDDRIKAKKDSDDMVAQLQDQVRQLTHQLQAAISLHAEERQRLETVTTNLSQEVAAAKAEATDLQRRRATDQELTRAAGERRDEKLAKLERRTMVNDAVCGYEGLVKAVMLELDIVKSERETCILLSEALQLWSSALPLA